MHHAKNIFFLLRAAYSLNRILPEPQSKHLAFVIFHPQPYCAAVLKLDPRRRALLNQSQIRYQLPTTSAAILVVWRHHRMLTLGNCECHIAETLRPYP